MFDDFVEIGTQQLISQTISDLNDTDSVLSTMLTAWKDGDLETLWGISSMEDYPGITEVLLNRRNNNWLKAMLTITTAGTHCVAVGGLHMAGEIGLLNQLKDAGYKITKP